MCKFKYLVLSLLSLFLIACAQDATDKKEALARDSVTKTQGSTATVGQNQAGVELDVQAVSPSLNVKQPQQANSEPYSVKKQRQAKRQPSLVSTGLTATKASVMPVNRNVNLTRHRYALPIQPTPPQRDNYQHHVENSVTLVQEKPVSTFSIDVDTASYANVRRFLNQGQLPPSDAVRVEELINYFSYDYSFAKKQSAGQPFTVYSEVAPSPYNKDKHLLHIGIQGKTIENSQRPASNLVFLIDVSGSMNSPNKIGLLKKSLKMLTKQLTVEDRIAIVVYAGAAGVVLEPTAGDNHHVIARALEELAAGGATHGEAGIKTAYRLAQQSFIKEGINRVILATDGDFNVGTVNQQALKNLIEQQRKSGIALSVLGFGRGNYNDALMQELAQNGNGNAYYIDTLNEARKVLVEELSATLMIIAKDVKIQVEFNPQVISEYRLVGYETRALNREDFNNDQVDAGEIGAGHTVTALYEVSFINAKNKLIDDLRYQKNDTVSNRIDKNAELAYLRLRYKLPAQATSQLIEVPIMVSAVKADLQTSSDDFRFSAAVAGFAQLLKGGKNISTLTIAQVIQLAQQAKGADNYNYRGEFVNMVKLFDALSFSAKGPQGKQVKQAAKLMQINRVTD